MSLLIRAWPPIGVRQEPSSTARKARSVVTAVAVSASSILATSARVAASSARVSMPIAPWPTAGKNSSTSSNAAAASSRPSRFKPATASSVASASPASILRKRVSTLPRSGTMARSGRKRLTKACRRSDAVPTTAPCGRSRKVLALALMKASRASSRGRNADSTRPGGSTVVMSFDECTARSMVPLSSASSISLVNSPLPPTSLSGRSWMVSPVVRMILISIRAASRPQAAARRLCTSRACTSANGEPREPMRRTVVEDCAMSPSGVRPRPEMAAL